MAPSSLEDIARQHQEALELLAVLPCEPHKEYGEVSLNDKTCPTCISTPQNSLQTDSEEKKELTVSEHEELQDPDDTTTSTDSVSVRSLENQACWSTRGQVDVSKLQALIQEGYNVSFPTQTNCKEKNVADTTTPNFPQLSPTNYWDPRNAAQHNVTLTRPSHDGWGIGKIVLRYSDDFLTKVYQLPWWDDFEEALQPIFQVLEESRKKYDDVDVDNESEMMVVRALLASLPPGVTIPIHNDSGEWVKTTHRVHVPVIVRNPNKILFRVGPAPHLMQRIDCTPGHVFEINNQAKHAVSNCDDDHRVHLILDYIVRDNHNDSDNARYTPISLQPGEKLVQTRRSIDRLVDMSARPTPSYIILGAQKAGTTSLYDYINQHPWVVKARRRETHCLDWRWNYDLKTPEAQLKYCQKFFFSHELQKHPSLLTGDSTPSYLLDGRRVIPRIKAIYDWKLSFFVMMRDPVRRAASHYAMVTSNEGTPAQLKSRGKEWRGKSLWQVMQSELYKMEECGLIPYWNIEKGTVDQKAFDVFAGSSQETMAWELYLSKHVPLNTGSYGLFTRGMYALQLRPWFHSFSRDQFLCLRLESMQSQGVQAMMHLVWSHLDLPNHPVEDESAKNTREYSAMEPKVESYLQRFFEPHNRILASVLQTNLDEWQDPWPYTRESLS